MRAVRLPMVLLVANQVIDQGDRFLLAAVFPLVKEEFRLSDAQLGSLSSAFVVVGTLAVIPFGILADRVTRVRVIAWGTALWSGAMILTGLARSYAGLFVSRMFLGTMEASNGPSAFSLITDWYPVERRARMLGVYQIGAILGFVTLPIGGIIAETWGWRVAFHVYAIPGFLLALAIYRLPEPSRGNRDREFQGIDEPVDDEMAISRMPSWRAFKDVLTIPTVLVTMLADSIANFFFAGIGIWAITFVVRFHDMTIGTATAVVSLLAIGAVFGALIGGQLGDRFVERGHRAARLYVAGWAQVAAVAFLFPAFATDSTALMIPCFFLGAITLTMPRPPITAVRADVLHPELRGRAASAMSLLSVATGAFAPLLFGLLSDATTLRVAFLVLVPTLGIGGLVLILLGPRFLDRDLERVRVQLGGAVTDDEQPT